MLYQAFVYKHFDANNVLLYIGYTRDWEQRFIAQKYSMKWWGDVASTTMVGFDKWWQAQKAESEAIRTENPKYNIRGNPNAGKVRKLMRSGG